MKYTVILWGLLVVMFVLTGCESAYDVMDSDPAPVTSFLPNHQLLRAQKASFPFHRFWYDRNVDWNRFTKVKVEPVDISYMLANTWWQQINPGKIGSMRNDAVQIASFMQNAFVNAVQQDPLCNLRITDTVDSHTIVVRLALVQLVPTKAYLDAAGTVAGLLIPGASLVNILNHGSVAMEGMLIDGGDNHIVAMFTDRGTDESAIIDIEGLTWYGHAKDIIKNWAGEFAELSETHDPAKLKRPFPFTLISI
ncbi:MAG: hypothetical protein A2020_16245 [Lentisphaerae bacterium GWF2_45_14]|nr:MAG: hypothetical protein A2020_16245 [Lentisphaerae bacterium GWF2_45_14]